MADPHLAWPLNAGLAGETGLKQPLLYTKGPRMPVSPERLASNSLSCIQKAPECQSRRRDWPQTASPIYIRPQNGSLAGETGLKQPLLYTEGPRMPVSPERLASNSLSCIHKAPKWQSRWRDWPQTASPVYIRPQNASLAGETGLEQPLLYTEGPRMPVSPERLASNSLSCIQKAPECPSRRRDWPQTASPI